jgi:hypothetical protein
MKKISTTFYLDGNPSEEKRETADTRFKKHMASVNRPIFSYTEIVSPQTCKPGNNRVHATQVIMSPESKSKGCVQTIITAEISIKQSENKRSDPFIVVNDGSRSVGDMGK